jgi:phytanoyl-CoA hydroxylase
MEPSEPPAMLTPAQVEQYRELGYLVVPDVLGRELLAEVKRRVDAIMADAAKVTTHTDVYDLEDSHSAQEPRVRRIRRRTSISRISRS